MQKDLNIKKQFSKQLMLDSKKYKHKDSIKSESVKKNEKLPNKLSK